MKMLGRFIFLGGLFSLISDARAEELRDVRPPVDLPEFPWVWVLVGVFMTAVLIGLVFFWKKSLLAIKKAQEPWEIALRELVILRGKDLSGKKQFKELYTELSLIARNYIEQRFDIRAPEMTTEEFLERMKSSALLQDG